MHGAALRELFSFSGQPEDLRQALHVLTAPLGSSSVLPGEERRLLLEFLRTCVVLHMVEPRENVPETALEFVGRRGLAAGDEAFVALPLARIHLARHRTTGSPGSLDRAQDLAERFDAPQESRSDLAEQQAVLASVSLARFRMYGEPNLLLDTLVRSGSALSLVHREDRIRRPLLELAHAEVLRLQHSLTRDAANLEEATVLAGRAVSGLPRTAVWRQRALLEVARCRLDGFRLNGEPSELDQAVEAFQAAASAATADWQRADRHDALLQRAECLLLRYEAFGDGQALELAAAGLENAEQELSFDDAPQDVAHAAAFASTVLALHTADSTHSGHDRDRDFDRALTLLDFALESAQADIRQGGAARASALLARAALIHGMEEAPSQLLHDAARGVEQVCRDRAAPPLQRLRAAVVWGSLATRLNAGAEVMRSYEAVTELLPPVLLLPADVRDHAAPAWEKLSREAAACAIEAGMPERALEFLELRGVLLSAWREQSHGDVDRLSEVAPSLATELRWLWAFLHLHPERGQPLEHRRRERPQAQLEHLLDAVRAVPGFEDFLSPCPPGGCSWPPGRGP
ncbi:hypothetical protein H4K36_28720 [Streptomyces sp. DHE7-1]|nr:hypothetical protein [Streptomyces sp. DHE7-1]